MIERGVAADSAVEYPVRPEREVRVGTTLSPVGCVFVSVREGKWSEPIVHAVGHLTPNSARELAFHLLDAADQADLDVGNGPTLFDPYDL